MATSSRIRGKSNVYWSMKIGAGSATNYGDDIKNVATSSDDADDSNVTFYEVAQGLSKVYTYTVTAVASHDSTSLFEYLWSNPGATFTIAYAPQGNATPTAGKPHFTFSAVATGKPLYELEANLDANYGAEFEYDFNVVGDITKIFA
jgi:hypothetical protein